MQDRGKGDQFKGEPIPLLEDMLKNVLDKKTVYIEVKCGPEIVPFLNDTLKQFELKPEQTPVISFDSRVIAAFKKVRPDVPAYWLVSLGGKKPPSPVQILEKALEIKADGVDLSYSPILTKDFLKPIRAAKLKVYIWTVNDPADAVKLLKLGVDGITTDRPAWLKQEMIKLMN